MAARTAEPRRRSRDKGAVDARTGTGQGRFHHRRGARPGPQSRNPHPSRESAAPIFQTTNALPVPWVEPVDISNAVLFLASDEARYITGVTLPVDAGALLK
jgi:NAD(P)-dependent dehydrogenase (short-subunit alcohol dehydrogenase family)